MKKFLSLSKSSFLTFLNLNSYKNCYKPKIFQANNFVFSKGSNPYFLPVFEYSTCVSSNEMASKVPGLEEVVKQLESFAPLSLAESWDNVGLLIEPIKSDPIKNIFFTNDLTEQVLDEAISVSANLIISYHPPIFRPLKKLTKKTWKERIIAKCLASGVAVYSPHTCWDAVFGGVNDWLVKGLPSCKASPIIQNKSYGSCNYSYLLNLDASNSRLIEEFQDFKGDEEIQFLKLGSSGSNLSLLTTNNSLSKVLTKVKDGVNVSVIALAKVHPTDSGTGRICKFETPVSIAEIIESVKKYIGLDKIQVALAVNHKIDEKVDSVAICAGSGASVLNGVPAKVYLTGEMSHHEVLEANHNDSTVILTHHSNSERGFLTSIATTLSDRLKTNGFNVTTYISKVDKDPLTIM